MAIDPTTLRPGDIFYLSVAAAGELAPLVPALRCEYLGTTATGRLLVRLGDEEGQTETEFAPADPDLEHAYPDEAGALRATLLHVCRRMSRWARLLAIAQDRLDRLDKEARRSGG